MLAVLHRGAGIKCLPYTFANLPSYDLKANLFSKTSVKRTHRSKYTHHNTTFTWHIPVEAFKRSGVQEYGVSRGVRMLKPLEVHLPDSSSSVGVETLKIIIYLPNSALNKIINTKVRIESK